MSKNHTAAFLALFLMSNVALAGEVEKSLVGLSGVCLDAVAKGPALDDDLKFMNVDGPLGKPIGAAGIPLKWVQDGCGSNTFGPSSPLLEVSAESTKFTDKEGHIGFYLVEVEVALYQTVQSAGGKTPFRAPTWRVSKTLYIDLGEVQIRNDVRSTITAMSGAFVRDFLAANPSLKSKK